MLIDRATDLLKRTAAIDYALRYNPLHYPALRKQLHELGPMGRDKRRALSQLLLQRCLAWAANLPGGLPADIPLTQRPIVEREALRANPERFLIRGLVRVPAETSGTTGVPVRMLRSLRSVAAEQAFIDDLLASRGFDLRRARVARLRADNVKPVTDHSPPFGILRDRGTKLVLSSNHLNPQTAAWYYEALRRFRPDVLMVHPSAAEALAGYLLQRGQRLDIPIVLSSSEAVLPSGRQLVEEVFNATLIDRYGMAERVASAAASATGAFFFNPLYGRVELLPVDDAEAPQGSKALEIVATGFWNEAMPLVRYRVGDRVVVPQSYGAADLEDVTLGLQPVQAIQGRGKEHLLSPSGVVIIGMSNATNGIKGLVRMQLVQDALDRVRADLLVDPSVVSIDEAQLLRNMRKCLSDDIAITVRRVERLECLSSGKTPFIIQRSVVSANP